VTPEPTTRGSPAVIDRVSAAHPADRGQAFYTAGLPGIRGAAAGLIVERGRVLLVERTYGHPWPWVLPGGILEAGESPLAACRRELREELGLAARIHGLAVLDWVPGHARQTPALHWVFTASLPEGERIRLHTQELASHRWIDPADIGDYLPLHAARRIRTALTAAERDTIYYLEHSRPLLPETVDVR